MAAELKFMPCAWIEYEVCLGVCWGSMIWEKENNGVGDDGRGETWKVVEPRRKSPYSYRQCIGLTKAGARNLLWCKCPALLGNGPKWQCC